MKISKIFIFAITVSLLILPYLGRTVVVNHEAANNRKEPKDTRARHALGTLALITGGVGSALVAIPRIIAVLGFGMSFDNFVGMYPSSFVCRQAPQF